MVATQPDRRHVPGTYRKQRSGAPAGFFAAEAAGLRWLARAGGAPVVRVLEVAADHLDLERLDPARPTPRAAEDFGRALARTHDAGAPAFGAPPADWTGPGFVGPLDRPLSFPYGRHERWGEFFAARCLEPLLARAERSRALGGRAVGDLHRVCRRLRDGDFDDDDPPARLHGDLWSGNVLWTPAGATLIDPAAHGGHRETDLALLALFGLPHLHRVLAAYAEVHPPTPGWQDRVALHQLFPLLVHTMLFGGGYAHRVSSAAARYV